jgi:hypothetical protein
MAKALTNVHSQIGLTAANFLLLLSSSFALSKSMDEEVYEYQDLISQFTLMAPMEGAGSHGSIGFGLGVGGAKVDIPENNIVVQDQLRSRSDFQAGQDAPITKSTLHQRVFAHKGFMLPVDIGGSVGRIPDTNATTAGVYMQQTIFERLALPAIAVRAKYSRLMGLPSTEFQSTGLEAAVSYGFLMAFNVYGTVGINRNQTLIRTSGETGTALSLSSNEDLDYAATKQITNSAMGLQVFLWPWFTTITAENQNVAGVRSWLGKVSVGL